MTREKQIEEMAEVIEQARIKATDTTNSMNYGFGGWYAKELYNAGYRKASEVAEEIEKYILEGASTIKSENSDCLYGAKFAIEKVVLPILEAYKKKYTEEEK